MIKGITLGSISIDCKNPVRLSTFYSDMLGWRKDEMYGSPVVVSEEGVTLLFLEADDFVYQPPVWPEEEGKQQKQIHFDFVVDDLSSAIIEAEILGAYKAPQQYGGDDFVTMIDPEGHVFCLCAKDSV